MSFPKQHHNRTPPALGRCKSFSFDVNQQAESLIEWEQQYDQHSGGIFNGYLDELKLDGIHLFEEFTSKTLQQQCCMKDNNLWLGFSLQHQQPKINNNEIISGQIMTRPSGVDFELITPDDFHIYGLVLNREKLSKEMTEIEADIFQSQSNTMQCSKANHYISYELAKLIRLLLMNNKSSLINDNTPDRLAKLMPLIKSKITDLVTQMECADTPVLVTQQTKQRVIADISNYIKENHRYPLTISELCQITHVSRRALQYCFEQGLGLSPIQYIRDCRLNEIRRMLLKPETDITISDLALDFGFFHLGTFNSQYKYLFGETPTQTMQRASNYLQITTTPK